MKKLRTALGAIVFALIIGGTQACADLPTAPADDADTATKCWWFDGVLHCADST